MNKNIVIPSDLFLAINNLCTSTESKILFSIIGYEPDDLFPLTNNQIMKLSGIPHNNNYFVNRKKLMNRGYLTMNNGQLVVNVDTILKDYEEEFKC